MTDQTPYDPYNPPNRQQPGYPASAAPVAQLDPAQGGAQDGQPPQYPPPAYNQYQQPPQPPKKKKTLFIVLGVVGALLLCCCLAIVGLAWIGYTVDGITAEPLPKPSPLNPADPDSAPTPDPADGDDFTDTKKAGNDTVGYLSIPKTWANFYDVDGNPATQFSNTAGDQIISMYVYPTDEVSAKDYADSVYSNFEAKGAKDLVGATVHDIPGYIAYQVYGLVDDILVVTWIFEDGEGATHYIAVEGPLDAPYEIYEIPQSFTTKKAT